MQTIKDEVRQRIIDAAREEFLAKGFENASIRTIATKAKTSKSNLYNYFRDKDHLFYAILEPTIFEIKKAIDEAKSYDMENGPESYTFEAQHHKISIVIDFVTTHRDDLKLLLFGAKGSSLEGFKNGVIEGFTELLVAWIQKYMQGKEVSVFFVRSVANFYLSIIEQLVTVGVSREHPERIREEFVRFVYYGWKGVLQ